MLADGQTLIVTLEEALRRAQEAGCDLVEVNATAQPPVCKLMDYGKYRFMQEKRAKESKKKQHTVKVKEVQLRPNIEKHDLDFKMRNASQFLQHGDKVKVLVIFRGREITHKELGEDLMRRVVETLAPYGQPERPAVFEGRTLVTVFAPVKRQAVKHKEAEDAEKKDEQVRG